MVKIMIKILKIVLFCVSQGGSNHFSQVCCSTDAAQVCVSEGDGTTTRWELTTFVSVADGDVTVTVPCDLASEFVVGVRLVHFFYRQM